MKASLFGKVIDVEKVCDRIYTDKLMVGLTPEEENCAKFIMNEFELWKPCLKNCHIQLNFSNWEKFSYINSIFVVREYEIKVIDINLKNFLELISNRQLERAFLYAYQILIRIKDFKKKYNTSKRMDAVKWLRNEILNKLKQNYSSTEKEAYGTSENIEDIDKHVKALDNVNTIQTILFLLKNHSEIMKHRRKHIPFQSHWKNDADVKKHCDSWFKNKKTTSQVVMIEHQSPPSAGEFHNKYAAVFAEHVYHIGDTHGDFESSVLHANSILSKSSSGVLPKNTVIVVHGDMLDDRYYNRENNNDNSVANLLFWLIMEYHYPNQVVLISGNHERKKTFVTYGKKWINKFVKKKGIYNKVSLEKELTNSVDKIGKSLPLMAVAFFNFGNVLCLHGGPISKKGAKTYAEMRGSHIHPDLKYGDTPIWNQPTKLDTQQDGSPNTERLGAGCLIGRPTVIKEKEANKIKYCVCGHVHSWGGKTILEFFHIVISSKKIPASNNPRTYSNNGIGYSSEKEYRYILHE